MRRALEVESPWILINKRRSPLDLDFTADQGTPLPRSDPRPGTPLRAGWLTAQSAPEHSASSPRASERQAQPVGVCSTSDRDSGTWSGAGCRGLGTI